MEICVPIIPELEFHKEMLGYLNQFAVVFRYPGESANKEQAKKVFVAMKKLRPIITYKLGKLD
jgi:hypothetical protein